VKALDVVIVGAGPAGLAAATACAECGLSAVLYDEQGAPGGQIHRVVAERRPARPEPSGSAYGRGETLVRAFRESGAAFVPDATVWAVRDFAGAEPIELGVSLRDAYGERSELVRARAVILATGALERPFPVPGWTLPGVMTAGDAQVLLETAGLVPEGDMVLAGCGPLLWLVASQLITAGAPIAALLDTTPRRRLREALAFTPAFMTSHYFREGLKLARQVRRRAPVLEYVTALAAEGGDRVEAVRYRVDGVERVLPASTLLLHQGVVPSVDLAGAAGCALAWNPLHACFEPVVDDWGGTSVPLLYIAGDGGGVAGAQAAEQRGPITALAVANALGRIDHRTRDRRAAPHRHALARALRGRRFLDVLFRPADAFRIPEGDTVACRCEEVTARQVVDAARLGCTGPNQAKAFLRCGMGSCQGRLCGLTLTELIARERGAAPEAVGYLQSRFPVKPVTLGEMAALPANAPAEAAVVRESGTH
jgi:NADPH-dependent 2,4-dienoyl-CoA reductase/sulfur reductase-like enzyme